MKGYHGLLTACLLTLCLLGKVCLLDAQEAQTNVTIPEVVAEVNGDKIMKSELTDECLRLHGEAELKDLIKKTLIEIECQRLNIVVTQNEINAEITRMAQTFNFSSEEWLNLLKQERNISPEQYKSDILWPILAIGKLAGARLTISEEEIAQEYDARFGPAVQVRQIVLKSKSDAERVWNEVRQNPESFASAAKAHSVDPASQPYGGMIRPIRRHSVNPTIEQAVFALKPGEVSPIIQWPADQFIIFYCEQHLAAQNVDRAKVREQLVMKIRDMKTRVVSEEVFTDLQNKAQIELVLGIPARTAKHPGVAAIVNGRSIGMNYLANHCFNRYGKEILSDMINKLLIEQACRKQNIVITDADIEQEIREMAIKHVPLRQDGSPNTELWMKLATQENRVTPEVYRTNTIWPVLALKRLSRPMVQVTHDDLQRGFEANFGKKVRCLAIVFGPTDQRRAQEVWAMANQRRTPEHFGDLAEKYSLDSDSRMARGAIPAIGRYCGQPVLEKEAFGLLPNEISQILQVDDNLVILYCLGHEEPVVTDIREVEADLTADIFEKKQKIAVARYFEDLQAKAAFDNYLTGESRNPDVENAIRQSGPTQAAGATKTK